ncbi:hypothetical protein BKA69DRAFT_1063284 [Paraphysoderma sedebokerense]|nr:hypothetical protein BKA69DRAFT_1063284 [Paraphysoderma sedebokerense]
MMSFIRSQSISRLNSVSKSLTSIPTRPSPFRPCSPIISPCRYRHQSNLYDVYLTQDVELVGKKGDIVRLRPGFARNYIAGTKKGYIIPRDKRTVLRHQNLYSLLGYDVPMMLKFYDGLIQSKAKNEYNLSLASQKSSELGKEEAKVDEETMKMVFEVLKSLEMANEVFTITKAAKEEKKKKVQKVEGEIEPTEKQMLYGSVVADDVIDMLKSLKELEDIQLDKIISKDAVEFAVDGEMTTKVKTLGKVVAVVKIGALGSARLLIDIVNQKASEEVKTSQ